MQELFEAIREACSRATWSRAVELARGGAVVGESMDEETATLKVSAPGVPVARTATLYLVDEDWSCDCKTTEDVCVHVAAAAIALRRARQEGIELPKASARTATLQYLFTRAGGGLLFERAFLIDGKKQPLETTLSAISSGRMKGPSFVAGAPDMAIDLLLGVRNRDFLPREVLAKLVDKLVDCGDVFLDGAPIKVSREQVGVVALLEDQGAGFRLTVMQDPRITELFSNGVALCGDTLMSVVEPRLNARELQELRPGRFYGPGEKIELMTQVLPSLRDRVEVVVRTRKLPRTSEQARARVQLEVGAQGDALSVLPTLVYGDPPIARVDSGRLVALANEVPVRDELAEERLTRQLQSELGLVPGRKELFHGEQGVAFARKLERWKDKSSIAGTAHESFFVAPPLVPRLELGEASFDLSFDSQEKGGRKIGQADAGAVLRAWKSGASLVPLLEGGWAPLPVDWLSKFGDKLADLLAAKEGREELPACALPDLARLCEALERPAPPRFTELKPLLEGFDGLPQAQLPGDLQITLRGYQTQGVRWLGFLKKARLGALLADDMGLGKTLQALCAIEGPALVVAPTSVLFNWAAEAARFRPGLKVCLYHGPGRELDPSADLTVTSYALLRLDADKLAPIRWKNVVLDEAQAIKNPDSQVARAAYRLQADFRLALTGTPVENRLEELWSQFHFLNPGLLGGRQDFDERYGKPIAQGEPGSAARLRERIRPFLLRRLKREVAPELPPRTEVVLRCELSEEERSLYEAIHAATREEVVARLREGGNVLAALEALLRLRQACCHPALIPGQQAELSSKVELLVEEVAQAAAEGHKALVFSQWTSLLDLVEPRLKEAGVGFVRLDGSTRDRGAVVNEFQGESGPPVMLISLKAGGAGLNLTAADHVFLLDPWWNPAVEDQAADRAHRIGQQRPVLVHRLVAMGTVEERILALQQSKRELAEAALSGSDKASSLTREDLLALLD